MTCVRYCFGWSSFQAGAPYYVAPEATDLTAVIPSCKFHEPLSGMERDETRISSVDSVHTFAHEAGDERKATGQERRGSCLTGWRVITLEEGALRCTSTRNMDRGILRQAGGLLGMLEAWVPQRRLRDAERFTDQSSRFESRFLPC